MAEQADEDEQRWCVQHQNHCPLLDGTVHADSQTSPGMDKCGRN
jgi:hypothetical protein